MNLWKWGRDWDIKKDEWPQKVAGDPKKKGKGSVKECTLGSS